MFAKAALILLAAAQGVVIPLGHPRVIEQPRAPIESAGPRWAVACENTTNPNKASGQHTTSSRHQSRKVSMPIYTAACCCRFHSRQSRRRCALQRNRSLSGTLAGLLHSDKHCVAKRSGAVPGFHGYAMTACGKIQVGVEMRSSNREFRDSVHICTHCRYIRIIGSARSQ